MPSEAPSFDLGLGTSTCSPVFLSFFTPYHPDTWNGFERNKDSTLTTYTDVNFVKSAVRGVLEVQLYCVLGLEVPCNRKQAETTFWFVSFELGNNKVASKKIASIDRPDWNEKFLIYVRDPETEKLLVRVHNDAHGSTGFFARAPKLNAAELPVKGLCDGKLHDKETSFKDSFTDRVYTVYYQVQFKPIADAAKQLVRDDAYLLVEPPCCEKGKAGWLRGIPAQLHELASTKLGHDAKAANRAKGVQPGSKEDKGADKWKDVLAMTGYKAPKGCLIPVAYLDNQFSDTQVWLFQNMEARQAVVAFRSTRVHKEWLGNGKFTSVQWTPAWPGVPAPPAVAVHKGFLDAYLSLRTPLLLLIDALTKPGVTIIQDKHCTCEKKEKWTLCITGSSLGGALAMLCAYDLGVRERASPKLEKLCMYSYGAPRVGDKVFSQRYHKYVPNSFRLYRTDDLLVKVPAANWGTWFYHAPKAVLLKGDGTWEVSTEPGNNNTSEWVDGAKAMAIAGTDIAMLAHFIAMYPSFLYKAAGKVSADKEAAEKKKVQQEMEERAAAYAPYKLLHGVDWS